MATDGPEGTFRLGERIGRLLWPGAVIALEGGLGAGKTVLAKGIASACGVTETVTSPTFTIISEYAGRLPFFHMDAYRLAGTKEFMDTGAIELLWGAGICVVEWAEKVRGALPADAVSIRIGIGEGDRRLFAISGERIEGELEK